MITLMYHDVVPQGAEDSSGFPGRDAALYKVTPASFRQQLENMKNYPTLTFEGGGVSPPHTADMLEMSGIRGHFFITANYIGTHGFLNQAGIQALFNRGHEIGSHSCSHPLRMAHLSD